jgi:hypothetical protein
MNRYLLIFITLALGALILEAAEQSELPRARIAVRVTDEAGRPVDDAQVRLIFGEAHNANAIVVVKGPTDADGRFAGEGYSGGSYGADVTKAGYYLSGIDARPLSDIVAGRWMPWEPIVSAILRPIGQQVPLHVRRLRKLQIPALDRPCGYDLEKGDWVSPHGSGAVADFIFTIRRTYTDHFNFSAEGDLTFSSSSDGIVPMKSPAFARNSVFRWERFAPEHGYAPSHKMRISSADPKNDRGMEVSFDANDRNRGYFFRVRSSEQNGRISTASFGKIAGDIGIDPRGSETCFISFTYYWNPEPMTRNLEWDMRKNLSETSDDEGSPKEP